MEGPRGPIHRPSLLGLHRRRRGIVLRVQLLTWWSWGKKMFCEACLHYSYASSENPGRLFKCCSKCSGRGAQGNAPTRHANASTLAFLFFWPRPRLFVGKFLQNLDTININEELLALLSFSAEADFSRIIYARRLKVLKLACFGQLTRPAQRHGSLSER